ncbi:glycosyltransferase family 4 protein [Alkalihalobacterium sp. APHAB7]|uniref:glycosyltransferase family 4 protein n=1 Tax=Alkalihalobacterium sp. APHAB7 TaxID=3402081 RepID=UPI003AAD7F95
MKKVCVITTVHNAYDGRIYHKQCKSFVKGGYEVKLIAPKPEKRIEDDSVDLLPIDKPSGKIKRMLQTFKVIGLAKKTKADIYHFHDPELLFVGVTLRLLTRKSVIFDVHEHYPNAIMSKPYLSSKLKPIIRGCYDIVEKIALPLLSGVIYTTSEIGKRYGKYKSCKIENYPLKEMFPERDNQKDPNQIIYLGGMTLIRGVKELVQAFALVVKENPKAKLIFVGFFESATFEKEVMDDIQSLNLQDAVEFKGRVPYTDIESFLAQASIGVIPYLPVPNHLVCLPNKMFEYMASEIAVVASDFPNYREVIEGSNGGVVVDPTQPQSIAKGILELLQDQNELKERQKQANEAFRNSFNWEAEEKKLLTFYKDILSS